VTVEGVNWDSSLIESRRLPFSPDLNFDQLYKEQTIQADGGMGL
jgi:hypothetical protein